LDSNNNHLESLLKTEKAWYFGITPFFMCPIPSFPVGEGDEKYIHPVASRHPSRGEFLIHGIIESRRDRRFIEKYIHPVASRHRSMRNHPVASRHPSDGWDEIRRVMEICRDDMSLWLLRA